jgi:hypothetical protein
MQIVFSLYGRPKEFHFCLKNLLKCRRLNECEVHFDINEAGNPKNDDVKKEVQNFVRTSGLKCTVQEYPDGDGADMNVLRTWRKFPHRILYSASDVLMHEDCLAKYLELNKRFPNNPVSLYHSLAHPIYYEPDRAVLRSTTVESLLLDPSLYLDYPLWNSRLMVKSISTIDWLLNWILHIRKISVYSTLISYVQHLGLSGGMTSSRWSPFYAYDYVDNEGWFNTLRQIGYEPNQVKLVRNKDAFDVYPPLADWR